MDELDEMSLKADMAIHTAQPHPTMSRRRLLAAALGAGAAALPVAAAAAAADPRVVFDAAVLNYLLKFEYIQVALYTNALGRFTDRDWTTFGVPTARQTLTEFLSQEQTHAATLQDLVRRLGLTPQPDCGDRFTRFRDIPSFLGVALALENAGVSAYLGIVSMLRTPELQTGVAAISSVESRHAAFVAVLSGESPAPTPADTPKSRAEALGIIDPYVHSCD
jgi:hypothetical protein